MTDFSRIPADQDRQIPAWAPTVGPGWTDLLGRLHRDLLALDADYQLDSFSTSLGGLRILVADRFDQDGEYDGDFADRTCALADAAQVASEHICEQCGAGGRPRFRGDQQRTWIVTVCETCRTYPAAAGLRLAANG